MVKIARHIHQGYHNQHHNFIKHNSIVHICLKEENVRDACSDKYQTSTSTVNLHCPKVDIHELREAERLFHQRQGVFERPRTVRRRQEYATGVHRIVAQPIRRVTEQFKYKYRSSHSRSRWIRNDNTYNYKHYSKYICINIASSICYCYVWIIDDKLEI